MKYAVIIFILLTGCASSYSTFVDPEFRPYSTEFIKKHNSYVPPLVIKFGKVPHDAAAICEQYSNGQAVVIVDNQEWSWLQDNQRRGLIFHELGHCILNRDHVETVFSYMYSTINSETFYITNRDQLDNEMFL